MSNLIDGIMRGMVEERKGKIKGNRRFFADSGYLELCLIHIFSFFLCVVFLVNFTWGCSADNSKDTIDKERAWVIVQKEIFDDKLGDRVVFVSHSLLNGGQEVKSWKGVYKVPGEFRQAWLFFVDDQPGANWEHGCQYIFVDSQTGKYSVIKSLTPPVSLDEMVQIYPKTTSKQ